MGTGKLTYLQSFRILYLLAMLVGLLTYSRGYDLFYEFVSLNVSARYDLLRSVDAYRFLRYGLLSLVVLSAVFYRSRLLITATWALFSYHELLVAPVLRPYTTNLSFFVLGILAIGPRDRDLSSLIAIEYAACLAYLSAAVSKLLANGSGWIDGSVMTTILQKNYLYSGSWIASWLTERPALASALGPLTLAIEFSSVLLLTGTKGRMIYLAMGLGFHFGVYCILKINFFYFFAPFYIASALLLIANFKGHSSANRFRKT